MAARKRKAELKVGFIGVGKMGSCLVKGAVGYGAVAADMVWVYDVDGGKVKILSESLGVHAAKDIPEVGRRSDVVFLAVKPDQFPGAAKELREVMSRSKSVVSIMAGVEIARIAGALGGKCAVVRVMPNVASRIREGIAAIACGSGVSLEVYRFVNNLFGALGGVVEVEEKKMDAVTALSGSGPAYVFMMMEALVDAGVMVGLDRQTATKLAVRTVVGAGRLAEETGLEPSELRAEVSSPGGTTVEAVAVLERRGFRSALMDAVAAAWAKSKGMSGK
ncbi:MAG: pyrroline-5-carboxylate reductase [bacterium]